MYLKENIPNSPQRFEIYKSLLKYGADIDSIFDISSSSTILQYLCSKKALEKHNLLLISELLKFLIEHGSNQYIKNVEGKDALAILEGNPRKNDLRRILISTEPGTISREQSRKISQEMYSIYNTTRQFEKEQISHKSKYFCC